MQKGVLCSKLFFSEVRTSFFLNFRMAGSKRASASTNASFKKQKATVAEKMVQLEGVLNGNLQTISPSVPFAIELAKILEEVRGFALRFGLNTEFKQ